MSIAETSGQGDRLATLRVLRDSLAADLDACDAFRDKAALALRFTDVLAQIEACEKAAPQEKGTALDEFTRRRQAQAARS